MNIKVAKFGGSSLCSGESIARVIEIIKSDSTRKIIVPSAPGKRFSDDIKVTDLLIALFNGKDVLDKIRMRYQEIIDYLNVDLDLNYEFDIIEKTLLSGTTLDYIASRGEYINAMILAKALGFLYVEAAEIIKFDDNKKLLYDETIESIKSKTSGKYCVIPGFYGSNQDGEIITFSRGGSDVTGSLCAAGTGADVYENWTDVSGFFMTDPRIVEDAIHIEEVSYKELRELSYMGAGVLHEDAVFPVRKCNIPVNIKNTNAPDEKGTMILPYEQISENMRPITGIAGKRGFAAISLEKAGMNNEIGYARRVLSVLEDFNISIEHMPTGIDTLSIIIADHNLKGREEAVLDAINKSASPDSIEIEYGIALIATVGHGMVHHAGIASRVFTALSDAGINILMIDQGSSELNIIIGVLQTDYENAVRAIYQAFV